MKDIAAEQSTMAYRAPELFDVKTGQTIDEKVDIWVCRVLFLHLIPHSYISFLSLWGAHYTPSRTLTHPLKIRKRLSREGQ